MEFPLKRRPCPLCEAEIAALKDELQGEIRAHAAHHEHENAEVVRLTAEAKRLAAEKFGWETTCQQLRDANKELKKENARLDQSETQLIGERDRAEAVADSLAYAVGGIDLIGEHSSHNCPWENALEWITPHAEVERIKADRDRLRDELARFRGFTYRGPHADGSVPTHGGFPCACEWSGEYHGDRCPEHGEVGQPIPSEADRLRERLTALAAAWASVRAAWSNDIAYYGIPARTQQALVAFAALLAQPEGK